MDTNRMLTILAAVVIVLLVFWYFVPLATTPTIPPAPAP